MRRPRRTFFSFVAPYKLLTYFTRKMLLPDVQGLDVVSSQRPEQEASVTLTALQFAWAVWSYIAGQTSIFVVRNPPYSGDITVVFRELRCRRRAVRSDCMAIYFGFKFHFASLCIIIVRSLQTNHCVCNKSQATCLQSGVKGESASSPPCCILPGHQKNILCSRLSTCV